MIESDEARMISMPIRDKGVEPDAPRLATPEPLGV
jgi:hypothetical protein